MTQSTSGFTTDEITTAVQQLVLSSISRPLDTLGVQRSDVSFSDIQQAAAGVFVLYPNSPFYVVKLGMGRLRGMITSEAALLDQLVAALEVLSRPVLPINDVSPLFNAQAALQNLGTAAAQRGSAYTDITKAPAYQQFAVNTSTFLAGPAGQAIKQNGAVVQTPQAATASIPSLLTQVQQAHAAIVALVTSLAGSIDNYNAVNLPSIVAESVLSNGATLLGASANALNALTPDQRLAAIRTTVLNLLATKAVVNTFGSFSGLSQFYTLDGIGSAYSDAQHAAVPAVLTSSIGNGFVIVAGVSDQLTFTMDGGTTPTTITLNPSTLATLTTGTDETSFLVGDGFNPHVSGIPIPHNNDLNVKIGSTSVIVELPSSTASSAELLGSGSLTPGGLYGGGGTLNGKTLAIFIDDAPYAETVTFAAPANAAAVISQISAAMPSLTASNYFNLVQLVSVSTGPGAKLVVGPGTANSLLGFTTGNTQTGGIAPITADQAAAAMNTELNPHGVMASAVYNPLRFRGQLNIPAGTGVDWTPVLTGSVDFVALGIKTTDTITVVSGPNAGRHVITGVTSGALTIGGVSLAQTAADVLVGPAAQFVQLTCMDPTTAVPEELSITVFSDDDVGAACLQMLGWTNGLTSACALSLSAAVAADINSKTGVVTAAGATNVLAGPITTAHANTALPNLVTLSAAAAVGTTTFVTTTVTYTVTAVTTPGAVSTGDTIALRNVSPGVGYTITTVNGSSAFGHALAVGDVVVGTSPDNVQSPSSGVVAEFGPTLTPAKYQLLTVADGPNKGSYQVLGKGDTAIDVTLVASLLQVNSLTSPTTDPLVMTVSLGDDVLTFTSKDTTTASEVSLSGSAAPALTGTTTQRGQTSWFKLPSLPRGLQAGDLLEYYVSTYDTPTAAFPILDVVASLAVIQVDKDPTLATLLPSNTTMQFTPQPVPFGRLRHGNLNDFSAVQTMLQAWLANPVNQPLFFENYNRLVNPLLVTSSPTASDVGTAVTTLKTLYALLTAVEELADLGTTTASLENIVAGLQVPPVAPIDALIQTYTQKGSDRAIDILLTGDFQTFFGLSAEDSSYAGAFQGATRQVAMNDLPVSKTNRQDSTSSQMSVQAQTPDYEYTANSMSESVQGDQVDPPTTLGSGTPIGYGTTS